MKPSRREIPALESLPEIGIRSATCPRPSAATGTGATATACSGGGGGCGGGGAGGGCTLFGTGSAGASGVGFTREHPASAISGSAEIQRRIPRASNISCVNLPCIGRMPLRAAAGGAAQRKYREEINGSAGGYLGADWKSR